MNFSDYLLFTQRITCNEYADMVIKQNGIAWQECHDTPAQQDRYSPMNLGNIHNLEMVRRRPFGDVLREDWGVLERLRVALAMPDRESTVERLIREWEKWHADKLEPICTYALTTKIGRELYKRQEEKKLVAKFVAENLIRDGDFVAIAEGSSATYVGMAIGLLRKQVTIITSNDPLLREVRDNAELADRFANIHAIGGQVDDLTVHGGVAGVEAEQQFDTAIRIDPGVTHVIMAVTGLLPNEGPYGMDAATIAVKAKMIRATLEANVRSLIFVTDYSKHLPSRRQVYGTPIFARRQDWEDLLHENRERIWIVTAPPPNLRARIAAHELGQAVQRSGIQAPYILGQENDRIDGGGYDVNEYDRVAMQFARITAKWIQTLPTDPKFIEACQENQALPEDLAQYAADHPGRPGPGEGGPREG